MKTSIISGIFVFSLLTTGCSTHIQPKDDTIVPSKVPFATFDTVVVKALTAESYDKMDNADRNAMAKIDEDFKKCMGEIFPKMKKQADIGNAYPSSTLLIEPVIDNIEKKTVGGRILLGPLSGGSAVLLKVIYTSADSKNVIAEPTFYAKSNAWAGAFTLGTNDNMIMARVTQRACDYTRKNM